MKLTLLSAIPCSRVDMMPCCQDGRGGWVYSQCDPSRTYTNLSGSCRLFFALSIHASPCASDDIVETTVLVARLGDEEIGTSTLVWKHGYWGTCLEDEAVFSWPQSIEINTAAGGLVSVEIAVKMRSRGQGIPVPQSAYCHIRQENRDAMQKSPIGYFLSRPRQRVKSFR